MSMRNKQMMRPNHLAVFIHPGREGRGGELRREERRGKEAILLTKSFAPGRGHSRPIHLHWWEPVTWPHIAPWDTGKGNHWLLSTCVSSRLPQSQHCWSVLQAGKVFVVGDVLYPVGRWVSSLASTYQTLVTHAYTHGSWQPNTVSRDHQISSGGGVSKIAPG